MHLRFFHFTLLLVFVSTLNYRFFANVPGVPSITLIESVSVILLMLLVLMMLVRPAIKNSVLVVIKGEPLVLYYIMWVGFAASIGLMYEDDTVAAYLKDIMPSVVLFYMVATFIRSKKEVRTFFKVYLAGTGIHLLLGFTQIVFGGPRILALNEGAQWKTDIYGEVVNVAYIPTGLFTHPNGYALFLIPIFLLLMVQIIFSKKYSLKILSVGVLSLLMFVAWKAQVKGMYIWTFFGVLLLLLPSRFERFRAETGFIVLLFGIVLISVASLGYFDETEVIGTMQTRYDLWMASLAVLSSAPSVILLGGGVDNMSFMSGIYSNLVDYPSSHNTFMDQVIVFGLPALLLYLAIAFKALRVSAFMVVSVSKAERATPLFLHSALVSLLGAFFFEPALGGTMLQGQFFLLCAMAVVIKRRSYGVFKGLH